MPNEKTSVESFLEGVGDSTFAPLESPLDKPFEVVEEEKVEEKPLPFDKDPKIQKYLDKRESKIKEELEEKYKDFGKETQTEDDFKDVMDAMTSAIGNDTPEKVSALNAFKGALSGLDKRATEKAIAHLEDIRKQEQEEDRQAENELSEAFENIEETFNVDLTSPKAKPIRAEFVTFVEKIAPKDRNGDVVDYPDMNSAWETFSSIKKSTQPVNRAKELANRSIARSAESTTVQPKRMDWNAVDEMMDTLKT